MTDTDKKTANAERQRAYRARHREKNGRRLDVQVSLDTVSSLELLALHGNTTKKAIIEKLVADAHYKLSNDPNVDLPALFRKL